MFLGNSWRSREMYLYVWVIQTKRLVFLTSSCLYYCPEKCEMYFRWSRLLLTLHYGILAPPPKSCSKLATQGGGGGGGGGGGVAGYIKHGSVVLVFHKNALCFLQSLFKTKLSAFQHPWRVGTFTEAGNTIFCSWSVFHLLSGSRVRPHSFDLRLLLRKSLFHLRRPAAAHVLTPAQFGEKYVRDFSLYVTCTELRDRNRHAPSQWHTA